MQPPATDIVVAHAPADASLASYYAIALRTQGAGASPFSPPPDQPPQSLAAQVRNSRALVVLVTDPMPVWASALVTGYRGLLATEKWRRIAIVRRGAGQLSPEMQGLPWIDGNEKPVEEVAGDVLAMLAGAPAPTPMMSAPVAPPKPTIAAGPPQWPGAQPMQQSLADGLLTRRTLLIAGLGIGSLGAVALMTSAALTRGFGLFSGSASPTVGVVPPLIFTSSGNTLYAIDRASGARRWGFTADAAVRGAEVSTQGLLYAISENGTLYALNTADGKPRWQASSTGTAKVRPVLSGNLLYVGSEDHNVYALNAKDGSVAWKFATGDSVGSRPVVANGVVFIGSNDQNVYALGASDGKQQWKFSTNGPVNSAAAVGQDFIYIGSDDHNLWALRVANGRHHYNFTTGNKVSSIPALVGDTVYVGSQDGAVYAINADSPDMRWRFRTGGPVGSSPVVANGAVYIGSNDQNVYALGASDGKQQWKFKTGGNVTGRFVVDNGVVYASSDKVYALDATSGSSKWQFSVDGKPGYSSPGISQ
jgi:eukaryotic-like serine/threonine-protein kinase